MEDNLQIYTKFKTFIVLTKMSFRNIEHYIRKLYAWFPSCACKIKVSEGVLS